MRRVEHGFTLVETILVVLVLAIASTTIVSMQGNLFRQESSVSDVQVRTPLQIECAEQVLAVRKYMSDGYQTIASPSYSTNACGGIAALSGHAVASVTVTDPYTGSGCPTSVGACKLVVISQDGGTPVTLMLVEY